MLTNEDIKKLLDVFATKQDLKEEIENLESRLNKKFDDVLSAVDSYAKKADAYFQKMVMVSRKMELLEKWLHQIADKVGIKLEYQ